MLFLCGNSTLCGKKLHKCTILCYLGKFCSISVLFGVEICCYSHRNFVEKVCYLFRKLGMEVEFAVEK